LQLICRRSLFRHFIIKNLRPSTVTKSRHRWITGRRVAKIRRTTGRLSVSQEISAGLRFLQKGYVSDLYSTTYNCKRCPYQLSTLSIPFSSSSNKSIFDPEAFTPFPFPFPYPYPPNTTLLIVLAEYALIHGSVVAHCLTLVYQKMISW
jgi:hypothetical protein